MDRLIFPLEIALFSTALCGLYALKPRIGLGPLYVAVGLFEGFLFFAGQSSPAISAQFLFSTSNISSMLFLPLLLVVGVLLYTLEGTSSARWYVAALALVYVMHGAIDVMLKYHALHPPPGMSAVATDIVRTAIRPRVASLAALLADFFVIFVSYQFLHNRLRSLPLAVPLYVALVAAMAVDSVVFSGVNGTIGALRDGLRWQAKLEAGFFAGLPLAIFLSVQLKKHKELLQGGIIDRPSLEIIGLKRMLSAAEEKLKESRAQYLYIKETFGRYVSPAVVDAIAKDPTRVRLGGELREVTVLFADIRGYSTLSERMSPTEIITLLNRYFDKVSGAILSTGGMINEFEGDGILAVFGAPLDLPDHADRAVDAALGMLRAVDELNVEWAADGTARKWQEAGLDKIAIRIGIHSGPVVAGNVGTEQRIKYAVIGDTVNTAARVEALNKELATTILCTVETQQRLSAATKARVAKDHGSHMVKGKKEPVHVFGFTPTAPATVAPV